jgi:two-component system, NtrC family, sensor histidine kinase HydH
MNQIYSDSALFGSDFDSFRRQESIFIVLNLLVLALELLVHTVFADYFGLPSRVTVTLLIGAFAVQTGELIWLHARTRPLSPRAMVALTCASIVFLAVLTFTLTTVSQRDDSQYFVLMVVPILEAAFRLSLGATLAVIALADTLNFFCVWRYFQAHPPARTSEYFEQGSIAIIYAAAGILLWLLVNNLRAKEAHLADNLRELERTRERLLGEEKLAAVGRLASAIAHEIRNPVAMISSSLATATRGPLADHERAEMFEIAAREASRLERLTSDFLSYARPLAPQRSAVDVADTLAYAASVCRARAAERGITIIANNGANGAPALRADADSGMVQQALLNLVVNAVDASAPGGRVSLHAESADGATVLIAVENGNGPIPPDALARIFEPFFTTKPAGTGLGLAISRNIARAHGGDLVLRANRPDRICFSLTLPARAAEPRAAADAQERTAPNEQNTNR